jgi:hypothetical protein
MKTTKILRRSRPSLTSSLLESSGKAQQKTLTRKSLRPMKSMVGIKSLTPKMRTNTPSSIKRA